MKTARGIYYRLKESEYVFEFGKVKFYFSSKLYRDKFIERYNSDIIEFNRSINNIYKNTFDIGGAWLALIRLYHNIEKRGFYIVMDGEEIECLEDLVFVVTPTYKKSFDA